MHLPVELVVRGSTGPATTTFHLANPPGIRPDACRSNTATTPAAITDDLLYKGYRTLFLENELLRVGVLLDKGADIFQFLHKPTDTDFLWRSPQGLIRPRSASPPRGPRSRAAFLDSYHGGWQEILPGGGPVDYGGAELGSTAKLPSWAGNATSWKTRPERISVRLSVDCVRTPLRLERIMTPGKRVTLPVYGRDAHQPVACRPLDFMWGHHPAFGAPFLQEGVRLFVPAGKGRAHSPKFAASSLLEPGAEFAWPLAHRRRA